MRTSIPLADPAGEPVAGDWRRRAACRDEDADLFFPLGVGQGSRGQAQVDEAKAVCARCPVVSACLADALESGQDYGVWGGLDEAERRALRRRARRGVV